MSPTIETVSETGRRKILPDDPFKRTILGLGLGILCGLFFGEGIAWFGTVGTLYVRLLQMTVLPYVLVAVISGIARLDPSSAGTLGARALALIGALWAVSWLTSFTIPLSYPNWDSGSFYASPISGKADVDLMSLFVPANIFESLANSVVPAVVVFAVFLGLALLGMSEKGTLLNAFAIVEKALGRVMSWVVKFAPLGVFAMAGSAAGTIQVDELSRLQIYLWTYGVGCGVLIFITLPLLVAMATPLSYWEVIKHARTAMVTAFAVGTVLVVIPLIAEQCKKLLENAKLFNEETESAVDVLAPTAYILPTAGTPVSLAFVLFAAWFVGEPIELLQYLPFAGLGIPSSFGGMTLAIPFLLDFFRLPADMFELYILGGIVTSNLWTATAAMHGVVICLLAACTVVGKLAWTRLAMAAGIGILVSAALMIALGFVFQNVVPDENPAEQRFMALELTEARVESVELTRPEPLTTADRQRDRLTVIRDRGTLRVGIPEDRLPFVFRNTRGELVGVDMELAHMLAGDLGVSLELIEVAWGDAVDWLDTGRLDLTVGGLTMTPERIRYVAFTRPYVDETPGFLIRDPERHDFQVMTEVRQRPLKLGLPPGFFQHQIQSALPNAELTVTESVLPFLKGEMPDLDALVVPAEMGSAWTLMYPQFMVVVPEGLDVKVPVGFAVPAKEQRLLRFMDNWLAVQTRIGKIASLFQYWVLGEATEERPPRWSIIRDVLHWVD